MKCVNCGHAMTSTRGVHRYTESGLSNVTLVNVETRACPECGERELVIPRIEDLHRLIARAVATSQAKLSPEEIRFLRKWLGYSSTDFALVTGVRPESVSRWESKDNNSPMAPTAERLLRMLVANHDPVEQYPIDLFKTQLRVKPKPLRFRGPDWKQAAS
jgi:putative zinc finger/helix-turn-helix YgiT family protein